MSSLLEIVSGIAAFRKYSQQLAEDRDVMPPGNMILRILFSVARRVLPENQCRLTYEDYVGYGPDDVVQLKSKGGDALKKYRRTFAEKLIAVTKLANIAGINDFNCWDCSTPTQERWIEIRTAIDRYLSFQKKFRSLISMDTTIKEEKTGPVLREAQQRQQRVREEIEAKREEIDRKCAELLLQHQHELTELGIEASEHTPLKEVLETIKKRNEAAETRFNELSLEEAKLKREKEKMLKEISEIEQAIPEKQRRVDLLTELNASSVERVLRQYKAAEEELASLKVRSNELNAEIMKIKALLSSLNEAIQTIEEAYTRCGTCKEMMKKPDFDKIEENIKFLKAMNENKKEAFNAVCEKLNSTKEKESEMRKAISDLKLKLSRIEPEVERTNKTLETNTNRFKELQDEVDGVKRSIKVASRWKNDITSAERAYKQLVQNRQLVIEWMSEYLNHPNREQRGDPTIESNMDEPSVDNPIADDPTVEVRTESNPTVEVHTESNPTDEPSVDKSDLDKPTVDNHAVDKSTVDKSTVDKSVDKPTVDKSVDKPTVDKSVDKSTVDRSVDKSAIDTSNLDKPTIDKSHTDESTGNDTGDAESNPTLDNPTLERLKSNTDDQKLHIWDGGKVIISRLMPPKIKSLPKSPVKTPKLEKTSRSEIPPEDESNIDNSIIALNGTDTPTKKPKSAQSLLDAIEQPENRPHVSISEELLFSEEQVLKTPIRSPIAGSPKRRAIDPLEVPQTSPTRRHLGSRLGSRVTPDKPTAPSTSLRVSATKQLSLVFNAPEPELSDEEET